MISVAAGVRYVTAKNTYKGHLRNISINPTYPAFGATGNMMLASDFFNNGAAVLNGLAAVSTSTAASLTTLIAGGTPSATPVSALPAETAAGITQILGAAGISTAGMDIGTAAATLSAVAPGFSQNAAVMSAYSTATGDINVDAEQTGSGITPIISVNITPNEKLNIALKYEFKTNLELTTALASPLLGGGIFTEGAKTIADMPALLAAGVEFRPMERLMVAASMNMYFDKNVDYDGNIEEPSINMIDKNFIEYGLGLEYGVTEKLRASAGWVATSTGVNDDYQNDQRYSTNTNSFGAGIGYRITPMIDLNLGGQYTFYAEGSKDYNHMLGSIPVPVTETYNKKTWVVGVGLDFYFGK
jgi:long-chain fatty acid transport protein